MANLLELRQDHAAALAKAEGILAQADGANRALTTGESGEVDAAMAEAAALAPRIAAVERLNTLRATSNGLIVKAADGRWDSHLPDAPESSAFDSSMRGTKGPKKLSSDYLRSFGAYLASGGQNMSAALYEGSGPNGGFAVPLIVDNQIVQLAPPETALRQLATVLPTASDIRVPRKTAFSVASAKPETGATANNFGESAPVLDDFTLSAFMAGVLVRASWEILQDVPSMQSFIIDDMLTAQQTVEEGWYVAGSGVGQPQGLIGNVGAGVTEEPDTAGNLVSLDGILDLIATLTPRTTPTRAF